MDILKAVTATYAVMGQEISDLGLRTMVTELQVYTQQDVLVALARCRKELRKLTLADIIDRIPGGHPGPEEAWAMVTKVMNNEQISLCWTEDMREAYGVAAPLAEDKVAARLAFKEKYSMLIAQRRAIGKPPNWCVSLGYDRSMRDEAVKEAAEKNLISAGYISKLLAHDVQPVTAAKLIENVKNKVGKQGAVPA